MQRKNKALTEIHAVWVPLKKMLIQRSLPQLLQLQLQQLNLFALIFTILYLSILYLQCCRRSLKLVTQSLGGVRDKP